LNWPGRQGVREKYFTAKGVRSPKSFGTAALDKTKIKINRILALCEVHV